MSEMNNGMGRGTGNPMNPVPENRNPNALRQGGNQVPPASMRSRSTSVTENKDTGKKKPEKKAEKKAPKPRKKRKEHKILRRIGIIMINTF